MVVHNPLFAIDVIGGHLFDSSGDLRGHGVERLQAMQIVSARAATCAGFQRCTRARFDPEKSILCADVGAERNYLRHQRKANPPADKSINLPRTALPIYGGMGITITGRF